MQKLKPKKDHNSCETSHVDDAREQSTKVFTKFSYLWREIFKCIKQDYVEENQQCFMKPDITEFISEEEDQNATKLKGQRNITNTTQKRRLKCIRIFF